MKRGYTCIFLMLSLVSLNFAVAAQKTRTEIPTEKIDNAAFKYGRTAAFTDGRGVWLEWQTAVETKNLGFLVFRISGGEKQLASPSLIPGNYLQTGQAVSSGNTYSFYDSKGDPGSSYLIESVDENSRIVSSQIFAPKYIADLTAVAGRSSDSLASAAERATPVIEQNSLNLPKDLKASETGSSLVDINTHRAIVAMPGAKIGVKKEGIYRVTRAELAAAGFNVNADSNNWQLYLDGVEQSIIVGGTGDYIEFFGKGVDRTESDTRVYYLVAGAGAGKRMGTTLLRRLSTVVAKNYYQTFVRKERSTYTPNILNGDLENHFGTATIVGFPGTVNFTLTGIDFSTGKSRMELNLQGISITEHNVRVILNGNELDPIMGNSYNLMTGYYEIPIEYFREGANSIQLISQSGTTLVESLKVSFAREYLAQQNQLSTFTHNYRAANIKGFTSPNVRVFDLTYPDTPTLITNLAVRKENQNFTVHLPANRGRTIYAAEDSAVLAAASVTPNLPSTLSTPAHDGDLIIISHKDFMTQANDWANYRRNQGISVEVVDITDIFDEFNFGISSALAIRSFLQYAKENWQTPPRYVLLIGDGSHDPRNYQGFGNLNLVPTRMVDTIYTVVPSDEALADFNTDGLSELAIGRVPARTAQSVTDVLNKTITFELTAAQGFERGAIFASDLPNGYDFEGLSQRLADQLPASMTKVMINRALPNAQTTLIGEMNNGRFIANYSGHGNQADWASTGFFSKPNVPQLTNAPNWTLYVMLSCLNGYFAQPNANLDGLSERLLFANNGGGVAAWSSTGLTTPDIQETMATRFYNQLGQGTTPRLGDLIKDAKATIVGGNDVRLSWALLGDPMLKVR